MAGWVVELRPSTFVGRSDELTGLTADLERALAGGGATRFIVGEPGIGKSTLAGELAGRAAQSGCAVLRGWAAEHDHDRPFGVVLDAFDGASRPIAERARAAAGAASGHAAVDGLVDVIEAVSSEGPLLFVFEDVQWADALSLRLLLSIGVRAPALPLLVLATMRPVAPSSALQRTVSHLRTLAAQVIPLDPFDATEVRDLSESLLGAPPDAAMHRLLERAGGNPLFLTELLAAFEADEPALVPSLRATILRRLEHFDESVVELLRLAAVLGPAFRVRDLATVTDRSAADLLPLLDAAMRAGVLVERLDRLAFRHDILRDSIYDDLALSARQALHREFAFRLAATHAPDAAVQDHITHGAEPGDMDAVAWLVAAAARCPTAGPGAVPFLESARSLCRANTDEMAEIVAKLAMPYVFIGKLDDAVDAAREALALTHVPEIAAQARSALAAASIVGGRMADGVEEFAAIAAVSAYPADARATALASAAYFSVFCLDPVRAVEFATAALAVMPEAVPTSASMARQALALATMATGTASDALALADHARSGSGDDPETAGFTYALIALLCNDRASARDALRAGLLALGGGNNAGTLQILHFSMAMLHYLEGDLDSAAAEAATGQTLSDEFDTGLAKMLGQAIAALIAVHRDELGVAARVLDQAIADVATFGPQVGVDLLLLAQALHGRTQDSDDQARAWLLAAWDLAGPMRALSMYQIYAAELLHSLVGADDEAMGRVVAELDALAARNPAPVPIGLALLGRAMVDGDGDRALEAVETHAAAGFAIPHARVCELAATVLVDAGRRDEAARLLSGAFDIWQRADATREKARVESALRAIGVRRRRSANTATAKFGWDALTPTEVRVAQLVGEGLTSRQVGDRLFISRRTVETHLSHIFAKLGVSNRSQVAAIVGGR